jgi:hypothetical protein
MQTALPVDAHFEQDGVPQYCREKTSRADSMIHIWNAADAHIHTHNLYEPTYEDARAETIKVP